MTEPVLASLFCDSHKSVVTKRGERVLYSIFNERTGLEGFMLLEHVLNIMEHVLYSLGGEPTNL
jgi:hypothetical protein